jgi:hypothetical protein
MWLFRRTAPAAAASPPSPAPAARRRSLVGVDAALKAAWDERTVGELRAAIDEVGWDESSLDKLLELVGEPPAEEGAAAASPDADAAQRRQSGAASPAKRQRVEGAAGAGGASGSGAGPSTERSPGRAAKPSAPAPQAVAKMTPAELRARGTTGERCLHCFRDARMRCEGAA